MRTAPMMKAHVSVVCVALLLAAGGCATTPELYVDTADEPLDCNSIGWRETGRAASIAEQRVRAEVMRTLVAKGYTEDNESPDCQVSAVMFTGARPGSPVSVGVGAGSWGGNFGGSVGVSLPVGGGARTVGHLALDVIDVGRNAEVWRGTLENAFPTPEPTAEEVGAVVRQILEAFPDRPAG